MYVCIYLFFIYIEKLECERRTLVSLLGHERGFKWKNSVDIWGLTPQENSHVKENCIRKLIIHALEKKILTFLISEPKHD